MPAPPPKPGISAPELLSIDFTSDHDVLTDEAESFADTGEPYDYPQWRADRQEAYPISQTRNTTLTADVEVVVADVGRTFKLVGAGPMMDGRRSTYFETGSLNTSTSPQNISVTAAEPLPNVIYHESAAIEWQVVWTDSQGGTLSLGSTPFECLVTYDTPHAKFGTGGESEPTLKRMKTAIDICAGTIDTRMIAELFADYVASETNFGGSNYTPRWLALDDKTTYFCDCENGRYLALLLLEIMGFSAARMDTDAAHPSTDSGTNDYPSDCSDIESLNGLDLMFHEAGGVDDYGNPTLSGWSIAECLFKVQMPSGKWAYTAVWGRHGPFWGDSTDEGIARKQALYKIMDHDRDLLGWKYVQKWGGLNPAPPLP